MLRRKDKKKPSILNVDAEQTMKDSILRIYEVFVAIVLLLSVDHSASVVSGSSAAAFSSASVSTTASPPLPSITASMSSLATLAS